MDEGWRLLQAGTGTELAKPRYQPPDPTARSPLARTSRGPWVIERVAFRDSRLEGFVRGRGAGGRDT